MAFHKDKDVGYFDQFSQHPGQLSTTDRQNLPGAPEKIKIDRVIVAFKNFEQRNHSIITAMTFRNYDTSKGQLELSFSQLKCDLEMMDLAKLIEWENK